MNYVFLSLIGLHGVLSLRRHLRSRSASEEQIRNAPGKRPSGWSLLLQAALFYMACYFGYQYGIFSRQLVSPIYIALGLIAGHLIFGLSLLITHRSLKDVVTYFFDFSSLWNFAMDSPLVLTRFISVAVAEEIIYRVAAQPLLIELTGSTWLGVGVVVIVFCVVHSHFFRNEFIISLEFLGFAILVSVLYLWTGSLILVIVIHAVRNIEISYLEYLVRVEELGDESEALEQMERALLTPGSEGA